MGRRGGIRIRHSARDVRRPRAYNHRMSWAAIFGATRKGLVLGLSLAAAGGCSRSLAPTNLIRAPNEALLFCGHAQGDAPFPGGLGALEQLVATYPVTRTAHYPTRGGEGGPTLTAHRLPAGSTLLEQPVTVFVRLFAVNTYESEIVFDSSGKSVVKALGRRGVVMVSDHTGQDPDRLLTSTAELNTQQSEEAGDGYQRVWSEQAKRGHPSLKVYDFGPHLAILRCS
jgi:hypothetical protein